MRTITSSIIVERPIDEVFAFVTDARNNPLWQAASGLKEIRQEPASPVGVGARITEVRDVMGQRTENSSEVTEYEPHSRYARSQIGSSGPILRGEYTFEEIPAGTRWLVVIHIQMGGGATPDEAQLAANVQRSVAADMATAKALLERRVVENAR